eukprot:15446420-Alexandrium_andersonii.AAC.1
MAQNSIPAKYQWAPNMRRPRQLQVGQSMQANASADRTWSQKRRQTVNPQPWQANGSKQCTRAAGMEAASGTPEGGAGAVQTLGPSLNG